MSESVFTPEVLAGKSDADMTRFLAEKCMGWKIFDVEVLSFPGYPVLVQKGDHWRFYAEDGPGMRWDPLTRIEHAFMLVEKMREKGFSIEIEAGNKHPEWFVRMGLLNAWYMGDTPSQAICLACIAALEGK